MPALARRTYDHRLRELVTAAGTGAVNDVALPRSTVASWTKRGLALVAFYVEQHNTVMPQVVLRGRTPDEAFRGEAADLSERLREAHRNAVRDRITTNRALACGDCPLPLREGTGNSLVPAEGQKVE